MSDRARRYGLIGAVVAVGLSVSVALALAVRSRERSRQEEELQRLCESRRAALQRTIDAHLAGVREIAAFFAGSQRVRRAEFARFAETSLSEYEALEGVCWVERAEGGPSVDGEADYTVRFGRFEKGSEVAWARAIRSRPDCREAIRRARETGEPTAVNWSETPAPEGGPHSLLVLRVPPEGGQQGVIGAVIDTETLAEYAFAAEEDDRLVTRVVDTATSRVLYEPASDDRRAVPGRNKRAEIAFADRKWTLIAQPTRAALAARGSWQEWAVLVAGVTLTALLATLLHQLTGRTQAVQRKVKERTEDLERTEGALEHERNQLRTLIDNLPDFVFFKDRWSRFLVCNEAHRRFLQARSRDDVVGRTDFAFFPDDLARRYYADEQRLMNGGEALLDAEEPAVDERGETRWMSTTKVPLRDADGRVTGLVGMTRDITQRRRAEEALRQAQIARGIQDDLLPTASPDFPGLEVGGVSHPAANVGADYFDYVRMPGDAAGIVVGDAAGHGLGSALLMVDARACLRTLSHEMSRVDEVVTEANRILADDMPAGRFVTLITLQVRSDRRSLVYTSAGHPAGYVLDKEGRVKAQLESSGYPLGVVSAARFPAEECSGLDEGDPIVLVTDGILEAMLPDGSMFGASRALEVVRDHREDPPDRIARAVTAAVTRASETDPPDDDMTAVIVRVRQ